MPYQRLARFLLLPELTLIKHTRASYHRDGLGLDVLELTKDRPEHEICPRCATPATTYYDKRTCTVKDEPLRSSQVKLVIHKHRWWCKKCKSPFTEPISGILPRRKTTQRFRKAILAACENFSDLSRVRKTFKCSSALVYQIFYEQLELKWREYQYDWPKIMGIDEHFFRRYMGRRQFSTVFTDLVNSRVREICLGRSGTELISQLGHISGRNNVEVVCIDLCQPYRKFTWNYFPNAHIVADKFHVLKLLTHAIFKERRAITGRNAKRLAQKFLLTPSWNLDYFDRKAFWERLKAFPRLNELYWWKEHLHRFYRTKGADRAEVALQVTIRHMKQSPLPEIQTLAETLSKWFEEVVNYFRYGVTNATTEGYNNILKLVQKRGFGYKSFRNYRLRGLNACA